MIDENNIPSSEAETNDMNEQQPEAIPPQYRKLSEVDDPTIQYRIDKKSHYSKEQWYAVYVHPGHELQIFDYLMGIDKDMEVKKKRRGRSKKEDLQINIDPSKIRMECFVPCVPVRLKYSDRQLWKHKMITPGIIFVRCKLDERDHLFHSRISEFVTGFLNDRTRHWPIAIPDVEMELFKGLVQAEMLINVGVPEYKVGQKVLVLSGPLQNRVASIVNVEERISRQEFETDRLGNEIHDAEGNRIPKHKIMLSVSLNSVLAANFEIDADQVTIAPEGAKEYDAYF